MNNIFDKYWHKYDAWYEKNQPAFNSEILAVKHLLPKTGKGLDIGTGTGLFAQELGIKFGIDTSINMLKKAVLRGIKTCQAKAENLPLRGCEFDFVTIIASLSFINDPAKAVNESYRVIKTGGSIILGLINKQSTLGRSYRDKKSAFYKQARFLSLDQASEMLKKSGFTGLEQVYTLSTMPEEIADAEQPRTQCDDCGFMVIRATKAD